MQYQQHSLCSVNHLDTRVSLYYQSNSLINKVYSGQCPDLDTFEEMLLCSKYWLNVHTLDIRKLWLKKLSIHHINTGRKTWNRTFLLNKAEIHGTKIPTSYAHRIARFKGYPWMCFVWAIGWRDYPEMKPLFSDSWIILPIADPKKWR